MERKTNWLAVIVAFVATMVIGFLWYGALFQEQWMAGNNITKDGEKYLKNGVEMSGSMAPMYFNMVAMVAYIFIMNWLLGKTGARTWIDGLMVGGAIGLIMTLGVITGNLFAANPSSLSLVDGSYAFVMFPIIGAILGGWQKK